MSKNKYQFESKIHVYRATKRMTQQELADLVNVSRLTIMQLERNRYNELVNNRQILLIGIWYGLPITFILIFLFFVKSSRDERGRAGYSVFPYYDC